MLKESSFVCLGLDRIFDIALIFENEDTCRWLDEADHHVHLTLRKQDKEWFFTDENDLQLKPQPLHYNCTYPIIYHKHRCLLYISEIDPKQQPFYYYQFPKDKEVIIGRKKGDIRYDHPLISAVHARLSCQQGQYVVEDLQSTNGVYVNQKRIYKSVVSLGDCIYIMGLQILIGNGFIAVNHKGDRLRVKARLPPYQPMDDGMIPQAHKQLQIAQARQYSVSEITQRSLKDPPAAVKQERQPLRYLLGPSLTMSMASGCSSLFMVQSLLAAQQPISAAMPSLIMAGSMLIGSLLWPILLRNYELRKEQRLEQKRQHCYDSYLCEQQSVLQQLVEQSTQKKRQFYVSDSAAALWPYEMPQTEMVVCLGIGDIPMSNPYVASEAPLQIQEDEAEVKKQAFLNQPLYLRQVPVIYEIKQFQCCHVIGNYQDQCEYARYLLYHHVLLYAPRASHVLIAYTQAEANWIPRFLPHLFHESGYRFLCCDIQMLPKALMYLHQTPLPTLALSFASVFTDFIVQNAQALPMILFSFTAHAQGKEDITITAQQGVWNQQTFTWQAVDCFKKAMSQLCNSNHENHQKGFPSRLSFLSMYHVTQIAHLQIEKRWFRKDYEPSLQALLGVNEDGEVLYLDLHERMHGPHGIVAGMTGSGKSELLITMLLSLAVNYHPYDCAFILIDYKGGGMAKALASLPHVAGVITNLDGNMINRSLASLQVEVVRRQQLFAKVMENGGYPSMDIDIYQKLYHEHRVEEIVPHLVIVADEFAELKQQEPQFMEQLIRIARIGRSLGIHLILATQKPSGIVDDQIWSNARFHICLKVAEQNDSIDMLKRKEGAQIKAVGRFYLQVGYDEVFIQGQSGYAKLPYDPKQCGLGQSLIQELADDGSLKREWQRTYTQSIQSEMNALIAEMKRIADQANIQTPHLWLPPLAHEIALQTLPKGSFAMVDDPTQKRQFPLMIEECLCNTVLLAHDTLCLQKAVHAYISALCNSEVIDDWRIVIIDAANAQLCKWKANHHVYAAITPEAKDDLIFVMQHMKSLRLQRNKAAKWLLIIHNIAALLDAWEDAASWLSALARDHGNNGIHVLISAMCLTDIQSRLFQQFENLFVFHLQDEQEARSLVQLALPSALPLRAMWKKQEQLLEVQFASSDEIIADNQQLPQLPILEEQPLYRNLEKEYGENGLIIGRSLAKRSVIALPLRGNWLISGYQWKELYQLLRQIAQKKQYQIHFHDKPGEIATDGMHIFAMSVSELTTNFHHPLVQSCTMAQTIIWSGLGLEENRYLWNLSNHFENKRKQDICWIKDEPIMIRRIYAYE